MRERTKQIILRQRVKVFAFTAFSVVTMGILTLQRPMEAAASTNPGLDSGNAQVSTVGSDTVLQYKTTGTSTFKAPGGVTNVRVMVIGGGGGGGSGGGGGGAGRMVAAPSMAITQGTSYTITVGGGGAGGVSNGQATSGNPSSIGSLAVAPGGGGGGGYNTKSGLNGGSGGGVARDNGIGGNTGTIGLGNQTGTVPAGGTGLGNNGGNNSPCTGTTGWCGGGGGGGASAVGGNGSGNSTQGASEVAGNGGAGSANDITGSSVTYAGGGGGGRHSAGTVGQGGAGGGGNGGVDTGAGVSGTANTGSGGGGGGSGGAGGTGGSGIVVIRFTTQNGPDPAGVSGVAMWYKADSSGNTNAQWNDFSGGNRNLVQSTTAKQPVLSANQINFNPAYVFDGTDDVFRMDNQGVGATNGMTAYFGAIATRTDGGYRYFNEFGDDTPSISMNNGRPDLYVRGTSPQQYTYSSAQTGAPHIYSFVSPNANNQSRTIGVDDQSEAQNVTTGTYATNSGTQTGGSFGSTNGSSGTSFAGPIGEAIYFNRTLTAAEQLRVFSYLAIKWGITRYQGTNSGSYVDSSGVGTIWSKDTAFPNRIAGIGRDDTSTLNQKQSVGSSEVTIGRGTIAVDNASNSNTFANDRSFLLWGDDGGATNATTTVTGPYTRINRTWKAVSTNTPGQVKISIPKSLVSATGGSSGELYTSSSTTFDAGSTRTTMTANGANYEATVTLAAGTSYFTFGSLSGSDIQFVSKTATDTAGTAITSYTPGEAMKYNLVVKNNGPQDAGTVTVTDTLPAGIVPKTSGATGSGWTCNVAGQTVTCTRTALANGATAPTITVEANIASNVTGSKPNTASASVANDPDLSNNSASVTLNSAPKADLSITKAHNGTITAGSTENYDFVVKNNGPSDVGSFTVTDTLDSNLAYASVTGTGVSCGAAGQVVTCTGGALTASGGSSTASFTITVNVSGAYSGSTISNTGTVAVPAGVTDPNVNNNSSTDNSNVVVQTDLSITKSHTGNFTAGTNNTFTITVNNAGPSSTIAGGVTVTDTLDSDFTYVSATGTNWTCSNSGNTVTCNYNGVITAGNGSSPITLTVLVDSIAAGSITNTAEESSTTPDATGNSTSTDTVTIDADADLALTKGHVGGGFVAGQPEQYTFSVTNNGPSADSPSYTITDTLPAGVTFVGTAAGSAASCTAAGQVVTCTGGAIGAGDPAQVTTIDVSISPSATGTINNSATVAPAAGITDSNSANNTGNDSAAVEPNADLSITKTHTGNVTAGNAVTYDIVVSNAGPSDVSSFTVTDTLDQNYTYQSATGATCNAVGQVVTCTGGAITNGSNTTVTITATLESSATPGGSINNTAVVAPPAGVNDPNANNNSSTATNTIDTSADLAITKTHIGNFVAGSNGTFTITATNNGPSDSDTATVTDVLPAGLTYVGTLSTGTTCNNSGQTVTCEIGPSMTKGASVPITLTVAVDPSFTGTSIDNTVTIAAASTSDPNPANNSDTDTVNFDQAQADLNATKVAQGSLMAGQDVTYRFTVTNNGPDNAGAVKISDPLPSYLSYESFTSVSGGSWNCSASGQDVTCDLGTLNNGDTAVVDVTVKIAEDAPDTAVNDASVTFNGTDTSANNPSASDPVDHSADLEVKLSHEQKAYTDGDDVTFDLAAINHGPSAAKDVVLTVDIPSGFTVKSVSADSPDGGSILAAIDNFFFPSAMAANNPFNCHMNGTQLVCTASTMYVNTYNLYLKGTIANGFSGNITLAASITSSTPDPNPNDTTATDTISGIIADGNGLSGTGENFVLAAVGTILMASLGGWLLYRRTRRA